MLNRTALIVRPAAPHMAWARSLEEGSDVLPDPTGEQTVYLVPSFEGDADHRVLLTRECGSLRSAGVWWAR